MNYSRIFHELIFLCIILGENGLVSRFNSGDLAGKCAASIGSRKYALRAENNCSSLFFRPFRLFFVNFRNYLGSGWIFCAFAQFFAGIGPAHFPAEKTRLLSRGLLPFSPNLKIRRFAQNLAKSYIESFIEDDSNRYYFFILRYYVLLQ